MTPVRRKLQRDGAAYVRASCEGILRPQAAIRPLFVAARQPREEFFLAVFGKLAVTPDGRPDVVVADVLRPCLELAAAIRCGATCGFLSVYQARPASVRNS